MSATIRAGDLLLGEALESVRSADGGVCLEAFLAKLATRYVGVKPIPVLMVPLVNAQFPSGSDAQWAEGAWRPTRDVLEKPADIGFLRKKVTPVLKRTANGGVP